MTTFQYRLFRPLLATVVVLTLNACASAIQSTVDVADQADFSNFQTYAWITDESLMARSDATSELGYPLNEQRTRAAVERELARKGYRKVSGTEADFVVSFTVGSRVRVQQYYNNYGYSYHGYHHGFTRYGYARYGYARYGYPGYGHYGSTASEYTFTEGSLVVDIFDNRSKEAIWHGSASKRLSRKDKDNATQLIDQAIATLLTEFPDTSTVAYSST